MLRAFAGCTSVLVRVGVFRISIEQACANAEEEIPDFESELCARFLAPSGGASSLAASRLTLGVWTRRPSIFCTARCTARTSRLLIVRSTL